MRLRTIKPGFYANEDLAALPAMTRLLFTGLWCYADRRGRFEDRPKRIKAAIFPYENADIGKMLDQLEAGGWIQRYDADGMKLICIPKFLDHQRPHKNEQESTLPAPDGHSTTLVVPENNQGGAMDAQSLGSGIQSLGSTIRPPAGGEVETPKSEQHPEAQPTCEYLGRAIAHWKPDASAVTRNTVASTTSLREMDLLFRVDGRSPERAKEIIDWLFLGESWSYLPRNGFDWRPNIQSGGALRKQWDRLDNACRMAMTDEKDRT